MDCEMVDISAAPGTSSHVCGICEASFSVLLKYLSHTTEHVGIHKGLSCELCGTAYSRQAALKDHYKKKHNVHFDKVPDPPATKQTLPSNPEDSSTSDAADAKSTADDGDEKTIHVIITKESEELAGRESAEQVGEGRHDAESGYAEEAEVENCRGVECPEVLADDQEFTVLVDNNLPENAQNKAISSADVISDSNQEVHVLTDKFCDKSVVINNKLEINTDTLSSSLMHADQKSLGNHVVSSQCDDSNDFHFVLLKNVKQGTSFKYGKDRFKCLHCNFKSYWRNSMSGHMKEYHADMLSIHQSIMVKKTLTEGQEGDQTIMKMSDYMASVRYKRRTPRERKIRSVEKQDLPGEYFCSKCGKEFNRLRYLRKHMHLHKDDKMFECEKCGKAFKTLNYLKAHIKTHEERVYKCSQCSFSSSVNALIHTHRQVHNNGSVICDVCGCAYADKSTLKKHMLVHDPTRPYACSYPGCTWRFKTERMCLGHYNSHTVQGKFRCSVCGYVFRHKHHLQRHQSKMHGINSSSNVTIVEEENKSHSSADDDIPNTVNLIVDSDLSRDQLQNALQNEQLVIVTDAEGNSVNYEVADITMNVTYHALLEDDDHLDDSQTILHVATINSEDTL